MQGQENIKESFMSVCLSVCPSVSNKSRATGGILMKFYIWGFFENPSREKSDFIAIWQV